jgi:hypothetical protein
MMYVSRRDDAQNVGTNMRSWYASSDADVFVDRLEAAIQAEGWSLKQCLRQPAGWSQVHGALKLL